MTLILTAYGWKNILWHSCLHFQTNGYRPTLQTSSVHRLLQILDLHLERESCFLSLDLYLEPGETTIPISVEFISLSPAGIGASLRGTSRVIEISGKELTFECEVYENERQIAAALIKRSAVERVSFLARTAALHLIQNDKS